MAKKTEKLSGAREVTDSTMDILAGVTGMGKKSPGRPKEFEGPMVRLPIMMHEEERDEFKETTRRKRTTMSDVLRDYMRKYVKENRDK